MSTSANHLDGVYGDNDESGVLCLTLYVTTSHSTESRKDDMSAENRLQLASYAASATNDGVINEDYHGM